MKQENYRDFNAIFTPIKKTEVVGKERRGGGLWRDGSITNEITKRLFLLAGKKCIICEWAEKGSAILMIPITRDK